MDNENKWEYDYSSEHSQTGETGYPNVGSSGMNTANTAMARATSSISLVMCGIIKVSERSSPRRLFGFC